MKNFLKKNWTIILVLLYVISPDLLPGPLDDTALLFAEITRKILVFIVNKLKSKNEV